MTEQFCRTGCPLLATFRVSCGHGCVCVCVVYMYLWVRANMCSLYVYKCVSSEIQLWLCLFFLYSEYRLP